MGDMIINNEEEDMNSEKNEALPSDEIVISKIYTIRGKKVMLDRDLACLYNVETRVLNQAVKRNEERFPQDFMFQMTREELKDWMSQIVISNEIKMGLRKPPLVFTELGVSMLSSVLNSERAVQVNIHIIRIFAKMREILISQKILLDKLEKLEKNDWDHDKKIQLIFEYLRQLEKAKNEDLKYKNRKPLGYRQDRQD